jgi:hypothetical protein
VYEVSLYKANTVIYYTPIYGKHDLIMLQNIFNYFDNKYNTLIIPDYYLEQNLACFKNAKTIVLAYHCEYFSNLMYENLINLVKNRNLISLGANQIYWRSKWYNNYTTMECRKDKTFFKSNDFIGGLWTMNKHSEAEVLGGSYCGMVQPAPYQVLIPNHFLFKNSNVKKGTIFGKKGIDGNAICGDETDKTNSFTPKNAVIVARGTNDNNQGGEIIYFNRNKFGTLNTGAITSGSGLNTDKIFTNILDNFMKKHH